jgi:hypothetical protein
MNSLLQMSPADLIRRYGGPARRVIHGKQVYLYDTDEVTMTSVKIISKLALKSN